MLEAGTWRAWWAVALLISGGCSSGDSGGGAGQSGDGELGAPDADPGDFSKNTDAASEIDGSPATTPCIRVSPLNLDLGHTVVGAASVRGLQLTNCGTAPYIVVTEAALSPESSAAFSLDLSGLGSAGSGEPGAADPLFVLAPGASGTLPVRYQPATLSAVGPDGLMGRDRGTIRVVSSATTQPVEVHVSGTGVGAACPTALVAVEEGEKVAPGTTLHLRGSDRLSAGGIARFEWEGHQPPGSQSVFLPSFLAPDPAFEGLLPGDYVFVLRVFDADGVASCEAAEAHVTVVPNYGIRVELVWDTPGDPNQLDEGPQAGADLDLHFAHPLAPAEPPGGEGTPDGWFNQPYDCYWFNGRPNWGSQDSYVDDNPIFDRDDTDGAGPEQVTLTLPEDALIHRIGVHYWAAQDFGPSWATVRVYIYDELRFESDAVKLAEHDLWEVATVAWPSGEVVRVEGTGGNPKISPEYKSPLFPRAKGD